jgi:hypothetical protein
MSEFSVSNALRYDSETDSDASNQIANEISFRVFWQPGDNWKFSRPCLFSTALTSFCFYEAFDIFV